jgi:hypothetical protein
MNRLNQSTTTTKKSIQKNTSPVHLAAALCLLFLLVSCVGTQSTQPEKPAQEKQAEQAPPVEKLAKKYDTLLFSPFTIRPELAKDYPEAATKLQQSMRAALQTEKIFKKIGTAKEGQAAGSNTLMIKAEITNMRVVSDSTRFWGGAFAGSSGVELDLQLIDGATNAVVRNEKLSSWNNAFAAAWSFGSSDHSLLDDMGKISARYVVESMPEK